MRFGSRAGERTVEGNCTTERGVTFGRAVITRGDVEGDFTIVATGYGHRWGFDEERVTGTVSVERLGADEHAIRRGRAPTGQITATTVDEVLDRSRCLEALSGTTAIAHDTRRDLITYDGAIDCDEAMSARWTADGVDQGLLAGIRCAVTPRRPPSSIAAWVAVLVVLRRMRRRSARLREVVRGGDARRR